MQRLGSLPAELLAQLLADILGGSSVIEIYAGVPPGVAGGAPAGALLYSLDMGPAVAAGPEVAASQVGIASAAAAGDATWCRWIKGADVVWEATVGDVVQLQTSTVVLGQRLALSAPVTLTLG